MSFKNIALVSKSVTGEMTAPWAETTLSTVLSRYSLENIFSVDEFGLLYQCLANTAQAESTAKFVSPDCLLEMLMARSFRCLLWASQKTEDVPKALIVCLVDTVLNAKAGCL